MNEEYLYLSHGSLFSGIGGFDLAAKWLGWKNIFQVEIDDWCRKILAKNFPETKRFVDIKDFIGYEYANTIDVISGGFPCQPFSFAGKRRGKKDDRYLWPEMLRVIATIKPTYVVCENVSGIISLELDNVLSDLEAEGYITETFIIPACAVNAPHRRDRVWIIAYTNSERQKRRKQELQAAQEKGFNKTHLHSEPLRFHFNRNYLPTPRICRAADGLPNRMDRLKGLGNAIVPQVAYEIFKAIEGHELSYQEKLN
jgi:DNA (cytosine-5)-methyltransferase 1